MNEQMLTLIAAILGSSVIGSILTLFVTRRKTAAETKKTNAEATSEEVDTTKKVSDFLKDVQDQNVDLYKRNTQLEKEITDKTRTIEILTARLEARDTQLAAATKQLDLLRNLAEQAPITETLRTQLDAVNQVVTHLQDTQSGLQKMILEKDKMLGTLFETNRNLEMKKPPKT